MSWVLYFQSNSLKCTLKVAEDGPSAWALLHFLGGVNEVPTLASPVLYSHLGSKLADKKLFLSVSISLPVFLPLSETLLFKKVNKCVRRIS